MTVATTTSMTATTTTMKKTRTIMKTRETKTTNAITTRRQSTRTIK